MIRLEDFFNGCAAYSCYELNPTCLYYIWRKLAEATTVTEWQGWLYAK